MWPSVQAVTGLSKHVFFGFVLGTPVPGTQLTMPPLDGEVQPLAGIARPILALSGELGGLLICCFANSFGNCGVWDGARELPLARYCPAHSSGLCSEQGVDVSDGFAATALRFVSPVADTGSNVESVP